MFDALSNLDRTQLIAVLALCGFVATAVLGYLTKPKPVKPEGERRK
jgi:hypothetical protein